MGRRKKQLEPFDSERFFNENRELCLKYMSKETANLDVNDIDLPQEMTYDRRMGIPSAKCDYSAMTILQKLEYIKCKNDLLYFTQKYITILSLDDGEIKFNLWDYQKELLKSFQANRFVLSVQSRQSGKTQTTAAYITWRANFHAGKKIAILANKFAQAKEIMARVNLSFERLPTFLKKPVKSMSKQNLEFEDLTEIFAAASDGSGIRGRSVTDLYWDEAAFTNNDNEFWESNYPVIASGKTSRIIVTSTPNGAKGVFYNLYKGGLEDIDETGVGKNKFKVLEVPYTRVPKYNNEEFRLDTIARIGQDSFEQEFACVTGESNLTLKCDVTDEIFTMTIEDLYNHCKYGKGVVYMLTRADGLKYIGITKNLKGRINQHSKSSRFSQYQLIDYKILYTGYYKDCERLEEYYIKKYNTYKNGLNMTESGKGKNKDCTFSTLGYKFSEESKKKMSDSHKKRIEKEGVGFRKGKFKHSKEAREKMSRDRKGKKRYYNISITDEEKQKMFSDFEKWYKEVEKNNYIIIDFIYHKQAEEIRKGITFKIEDMLNVNKQKLSPYNIFTKLYYGLYGKISKGTMLIYLKGNYVKNTD